MLTRRGAFRSVGGWCFGFLLDLCLLQAGSASLDSVRLDFLSETPAISSDVEADTE